MIASNAPLSTSLNSARHELAAGPAIALNVESGAPEWAQLLPKGPTVRGRDGRSWTLDDPQTVLNAFAANGGPIAIDYEHAQDRLASKGVEAPASGWIEAMETRDGEIWGRVSWTPRAGAAINAKEYRFLSPAFAHSSEGKILAIVGAGLVNRPNLKMAALNGEQNMDLTALCAALGLPSSAALADIVTAVNALKSKAETALNSQQPDLNKFVPRADYEIAINRATTAENKIASEAAARRDAEIAEAVDGAVREGKIAPASKDFYLSTCRAEGGLDQFKTFIASQASQFKPAIDQQKGPATGDKTALNAEELAMATAFGLSPEEFAKGKAA